MYFSRNNSTISFFSSSSLDDYFMGEKSLAHTFISSLVAPVTPRELCIALFFGFGIKLCNFESKNTFLADCIQESIYLFVTYIIHCAGSRNPKAI